MKTDPRYLLVNNMVIEDGSVTNGKFIHASCSNALHKDH